MVFSKAISAALLLCLASAVRPAEFRIEQGQSLNQERASERFTSPEASPECTACAQTACLGEDGLPESIGDKSRDEARAIVTDMSVKLEKDCLSICGAETIKKAVKYYTDQANNQASSQSPKLGKTQLAEMQQRLDDKLKGATCAVSFGGPNPDADAAAAMLELNDTQAHQDPARMCGATNVYHNPDWFSRVRDDGEGERVGKGNQAAIFKVKQDNHARGAAAHFLAMKVALNDDLKTDIDYEKKIMDIGVCKNCSSLMMPLKDGQPCGHVGEDAVWKPYYSGAYVTILMNGGDLDKGWLQPYADYVPNCKHRVFRQLFKALNCLHEKVEYVHGDFKGDNVFFESVSMKTGCPRGIKLADFGLSQARGARMSRYDWKWLPRSWHLPGAVFDGYPDAISLNGYPQNFDRFIDYCSLLKFARVDLGISYPMLKSGSQIFDGSRCGIMGPRTWTPVDCSGCLQPLRTRTDDHEDVPCEGTLLTGRKGLCHNTCKVVDGKCSGFEAPVRRARGGFIPVGLDASLVTQEQYESDGRTFPDTIPEEEDE